MNRNGVEYILGYARKADLNNLANWMHFRCVSHSTVCYTSSSSSATLIHLRLFPK